MALLEVRGVSRRFGDFEAVREVSFAVEAGEFFTLLGPSGCGKTTLLRMIAGFEEPDAGEIRLDGASLAGIPPERRPVHTVFQSYALFPHLSVRGNVAFPLEMAHESRDRIARRVGEALEEVRLADVAGRYPDQLSGGQKQRVALARALVNRPRLLLLDEPLAALDAKLREEMGAELAALQREVGVTFVFVTHAQEEALAMSHRIAVMDRGRIEQLDTPQRLYGAPASRFVADFIGHINLLDARVVHPAEGPAALEVPGLGTIAAPLDGIAAGARGALALRPEMLRIARHEEKHGLHNHFRGRVDRVTYLGDATQLVVALERGPKLKALVPNAGPGPASEFRRGEEVVVAWRHDAGVFLREA